MLLAVHFSGADDVLRDITSRLRLPRVLPVRLIQPDAPVLQRPVTVYHKPPTAAACEGVEGVVASESSDTPGGSTQDLSPPAQRRSDAVDTVLETEQDQDSAEATLDQAEPRDGSSPAGMGGTEKQLQGGSLSDPVEREGDSVSEEGMVTAAEYLAQTLPHLFTDSVHVEGEGGDRWPAR